jgi:AraC family transcriptional regulator
MGAMPPRADYETEADASRRYRMVPTLALEQTVYAGALVQPTHHHDALQLSMLLNGGVEETVAGVCHVGAPLHISVKDAGVDHDNRWAPGGARLIRLEASNETLANLTACDSAPSWRWRFDPVAIRAFLRLTTTSTSADRVTVDASDPDCSDLLAALVARPVTKTVGAPPVWLVEVVRSVEATWSPQLGTQALARSANVHPVYLARCVRRWYGVSVGDLLRCERLRRTVALLANARDRVALVAHQQGFADEAHCTRTIRAALGVTPAALRRRLVD